MFRKNTLTLTTGVAFYDILKCHCSATARSSKYFTALPWLNRSKSADTSQKMKLLRIAACWLVEWHLCLRPWMWEDISSRSTVTWVSTEYWVVSPVLRKLSLTAPGKAKSWRLPRLPMRLLAPQGNETLPMNCSNNAPREESIDSYRFILYFPLWKKVKEGFWFMGLVASQGTKERDGQFEGGEFARFHHYQKKCKFGCRPSGKSFDCWQRHGDDLSQNGDCLGLTLIPGFFGGRLGDGSRTTLMQNNAKHWIKSSNKRQLTGNLQTFACGRLFFGKGSSLSLTGFGVHHFNRNLGDHFTPTYCMYSKCIVVSRYSCTGPWGIKRHQTGHYLYTSSVQIESLDRFKVH